MSDIRDNFPPPPCLECGEGMCVKAQGHDGYRCAQCGYEYAFQIAVPASARTSGPYIVRPMVMALRLTVGHWLGAMEQAITTMEYERVLEAVHTMNKWLGEVGHPMADQVRQVKHGQNTEPLPEEIPKNWLDEMP